MKTNDSFLLLATVIVAIFANFAFSQEGGGEDKIRFGSRIAYAIPVDIRYTDGMMDFPQSIEIGGIIAIPIVNTITFNSGFNFIYRSWSDYGATDWDLDDGEYYELKALSLSIPALFRGIPLEYLYLEGGFQLEFPPFIIGDGEWEGSPIDVRFMLGFGLNINEHIAFGSRNSINLISSENRFVEIGLGLIYLF